jgi:hypothetical protein
MSTNNIKNFRVYWNVLIGLMAVLVAVIYPLNLIFNFISSKNFIFIECTLTIIFALDIFIWDFFIKAWHKEHSSNSLKHFAFNIRIDLLPDLIAAIPFIFIFHSPIFLLLRLIKLIKVAQLMHHLRQSIIRYSGYLIIIFFIFWLMLIYHWVACGWIFLRGVDLQFNQETNYINALYWTVTTLTTVGYGDITAQTNIEKLYTILVEILGVFVYGYLIANVVSIISKRNPAKAQFDENLEKLSVMAQLRDIPYELQRKIKDYYVYMWHKKLGFDESEFLKGLPDGLKREVSLQLKNEIVNTIPLFKNTDENFMMDIALRLKPVVAIPGEMIIKEGDIGNEMYFILKGEMSLVTSKSELKVLRDGDFFGEIALFQNVPRTVSIRAETYCDLYSLEKQNFDFVMNKYPEFAVKIKAQADLRDEVVHFIENNNLHNNKTDGLR